MNEVLLLQKDMTRRSSGLLLLLLLCAEHIAMVSSDSFWGSAISTISSGLNALGITGDNNDIHSGGKQFIAMLHFNGECCDNGHVVHFKRGSNLQDVRIRASRAFAKELGSDVDPATITLYDDIGLVTNLERIIIDDDQDEQDKIVGGTKQPNSKQNLNLNPNQLWVVPKGALFVWPTVSVGHVQRPRGVVSANLSRPLELETLSLSPRVFFVRNFLSDEEIEQLIAFAKNKLKRSHVGIGNEVFSDDRTSKTAWDTSSPNSMTIQQRAFDLVRIPYAQNQADAVQIIRYFEGQTYVGHTDYFDGGYDNIDPSKEGGTNRFMTIFAYLTDVEEGGHTVFPKSRTHPSHMTARVASKVKKKQKNVKKSKRTLAVSPDGSVKNEEETTQEENKRVNENEGGMEEVEEDDIGSSNDKTCLGWRQTKDCDPNGIRFPTGDMKCKKRVANGKSGYCECGNGRKVMRVTCEHSAFLCSNACAGRVSDGTVQTGSSFDTFVRECDAGDGLVVAPRRGDALLFYSQSPAGRLDPNSYHGGCPVIRGTKWASNVWIWNRKRPIFDGGTKKQTNSNDLKMVFLNTKSFVVEVYWQSYDGPLKYFDQIQPGQSYSVDTYTGHVWIIKKKDGGEEITRKTAAKGINSAVSV